MSKVTAKWIADLAIESQHMSAGASQAVLQTHLAAARVGVSNFTTAAASSDDVSAEINGAATTDEAQTSLAAKGYYAGAVADAADVKRVLIRLTGSDNGQDDGTGDEVYGVITTVAEITDITTPAASTLDFNGAGLYWTLASPSTSYYVWYNVTDGANTQTDPAPGGTGIQVDVVAADTATQVAVKTAAVIDALGDFSVPVPGTATMTITQANGGTVTDAADVDAGVTPSVTTQGSIGLAYKKADGTAYTFAATAIDFYFVETFDLDDMPADAMLHQSVSGVIDAASAAALSAHLDGGVNKHDASEIDYENASGGTIATVGSAEAAIGQLDTSLAGHLDGTASQHDGTEIDYERTDADKVSILEASDEVEAALSNLDDSKMATISVQLAEIVNLALTGEQTIDGTLTSTSRVLLTNQTAPAENGVYVTAAGAWARATDLSKSSQFIVGQMISVREGTDRADTIWFNQTVVATVDTTAVDIDQAGDPAALTAHLDGTASKHDATEIDYERGDGSKKNIQAASDDAEAALTDLDDAIGALDATPTNYTPTSAAITADHLAAIDGILGTLSAADETENVDQFTLDGTDITNEYVDLVNIPKSVTNVRMFIKNAPPQHNGDDFTIITDGSDIKRVSWSALGLDGVLASGDKLTLVYTV